MSDIEPPSISRPEIRPIMHPVSTAVNNIGMIAQRLYGTVPKYGLVTDLIAQIGGLDMSGSDYILNVNAENWAEASRKREMHRDLSSQDKLEISLLNQERGAACLAISISRTELKVTVSYFPNRGLKLESVSESQPAQLRIDFNFEESKEYSPDELKPLNEAVRIIEEASSREKLWDAIVKKAKLPEIPDDWPIDKSAPPSREMTLILLYKLL